ncbi:Flavohemoprotein (Hemoglobin-like protein) (Flavohemoglobin) (Nitric oxide dioxygenase) [Enhygromyxa salina]|uniref:nitric oxide dioxygenase n=1 Tax=Enhygromyxa salina TaxID=215803 RepID=A0A0C2D0H0_9BACT|nr:globin domain-containing protein [Enhygromyxa salina]KIG16701.1 Flavohemoprotein (Hemoglobin-like protein) (Flavohemoglobin) (Nitric oxide dioxygenase) [Enhygromyxa salina]
MLPTQIELIRASLPTLREQAIPITQAMYRRMFAANPEVARMFNPAHMHPDGQQGALAGAIVAYAEHLDELEVLHDALAVIVHKHVAVQVQPIQYDVVGGHLLAAIAEVLGDAATPELMDTWAAAYGELADVCIAAERGVYEQQRVAPGGWTGLREFEVVERRALTPMITSLRVSPVDRQRLPTFAPGQHVSVALPGADSLALRQYSITQAPGGDSWRFVIKAEPARDQHEPGVVSNRLTQALELGAKLNLTMPCGCFTLDPTAGDHAIVLLAGGVGVTPLFSMAAASVAAKPARPLLFVHAALDRSSRPLEADLRELANVAPGFRYVRIHEQPAATERLGVDYDHVGLLDHARLTSLLPADPVERAEIECWTCGPDGFMVSVDAALERLAVPRARRHFEFFGPARPLTES